MNALNLKLALNDGALLRVLGVTERRGYPLINVDAQTDDDQNELQVTMYVRSSRPVRLLVNQLRKLHDVLNVEVTK